MLPSFKERLTLYEKQLFAHSRGACRDDVSLIHRAQFDTATVLGTVRDKTQAIVASATVTLTNVATGVSQTMSTNEGGEYEFFNVKIGKYKVTAEARGFKKGLADEFTVTVNARQRVTCSPSPRCGGDRHGGCGGCAA